MKHNTIVWLALVVATLLLVVVVIAGTNKTLQGYADTRNAIATRQSAIEATYQTQNP